MCGIVGFFYRNNRLYSSDEEYNLINLMMKSIKHRGPNDEGICYNKKGVFGNVRLSIIDIENGKQPIYNEDKKIGIVYNGEIYNYKEIKNKIELNHTFETNTDTETIVHFYEDKGIDSFNDFEGMFSFMLWDEKNEKYYLVRDKVGIKPLYYYKDNDVIFFSSEIKTLIKILNNTEIDPVGLYKYLVFRYVTAPHTIFKNIYKLEPGCYLDLQSGEVKKYKRDINVEISSNIEEQLYEMINNSVKSQLMSEVPVGVFLSGGIDSSIISYFIKKTGSRLKSFNIGFPDVNEFKYSRDMAKFCNLDHVEILMTNNELIDYIPKFIESIDEPVSDIACIPLYRLCEEVKKHVTVVLSGEGGDEIFGGYGQYSSTLNKFNNISKESFNLFMKNSSYFMDSNKYFKNINIDFFDLFKGSNLLDSMMQFDQKTWIPDNLMMKADKILMHHSLEGRFPFLNTEIISFMNKLGNDYKIKNGETKVLLKRLMSKYLPRDIVYRQKMGFSVPVGLVLNSIKNEIFDLMSKIDIPFININEIKKDINDYYLGNGKCWKIWSIYVLLKYMNEVKTCKIIV